MSAGATNHANLALQLPADAYWHLVHTLRLTLPPPPTDNPDDLRRRDHAAIARIAALAPANAAEADLAAQFVAASEQWKDCLRLAQEPETTPQWAAKCRAQALAMMRQANGALRLLLRLQAARAKLEADNAARDRAAWTEHCAIGLMAEALPAHAAPAPTGRAQTGFAEPAAPSAAERRPRPEPLAQAEPAPLADLPSRQVPDGAAGEASLVPEPPCPAPPSRLAAADRSAIMHAEQAAPIRRTGPPPEARAA